MKNQDVVKNFLNGKSAKSLNMTSEDNRLFSYNTIIAQIIYKDGKKILLVNRNKYSITTSCKHQSPLFRAIEGAYKYNFDEIRNITDYVRINTQNLEGLIK